MSSKSVSMIKKHRMIRQELKKFPIFEHRGQTSSLTEFKPKLDQWAMKQEIKKKSRGLQKGKSLELERSKLYQGSVNNFKKTIENIKLKNSALVKKKRNKTIKQSSISRTSLISSENLLSLPSTTILNCETEMLRLS